MKRRDFIASVIITSSIAGLAACEKLEEESSLDNNLYLQPYSGEWTKKEVMHLLGRTTFGINKKQLDDAVNLDRATIVQQLLFKKEEALSPPINTEFEEDIFVPIGETWVDAPYSRTIFYERYRNKSIRAWIMNVIFKEEISLSEQMTLFWHNHFGVSNTIEHKAEYIHNEILRKFALGNVKDLTKEISIETSMLHFLNGNESTAKSPNENFARELLELFTVGRGAVIAPGDYGTFTEDDVAEIAKAFTGWRDKGWYAFEEGEIIEATFDSDRHDDSVKKLSYHFHNEKIHNAGQEEYKNVIDILFKQKNTALHICRKIYRWFIYSNINDEIEKNIILPLANILIKNNFEIQPVLETLFNSNHFYSMIGKGAKIKNPLEYMMGVLKKFKVKIPQEMTIKNDFWFEIFELGSLMQLEYFKPPSVAGWKAYYQEPQYDKSWINGSSLQYRNLFISKITIDGFIIGNEKIIIDSLVLLDFTGQAENPEQLITDICEILFVLPLTTEQKTQLKEILLGGLSHETWEYELNQYLQNPLSLKHRTPLERRLRKLLNFLLKMPEYYLH